MYSQVFELQLTAEVGLSGLATLLQDSALFGICMSAHHAGDEQVRPSVT